MNVCVCGREREHAHAKEGGREGKSVYVCVFVCENMFVCIKESACVLFLCDCVRVYVYAYLRERERNSECKCV